MAEEIARAMPSLNETERRIAVTLYRALAEGYPVEHSEIARLGALDKVRVDEILEGWPGIFRGDNGQVQEMELHIDGLGTRVYRRAEV